MYRESNILSIWNYLLKSKKKTELKEVFYLEPKESNFYIWKLEPKESKKVLFYRK